MNPQVHLIDAALDRWQTAPAGAQPAANQRLALADWLAGRESWPAGLPVALRLVNTDAVDALAESLAAPGHPIALIELDFPAWTDGRAYSQARLLRSRLRFAGELRAVGQVRVDMLPLLARCGFSSAVLEVAAVPAGLSPFGGHYQADLLQSSPRYATEAQGA